MNNNTMFQFKKIHLCIIMLYLKVVNGMVNDIGFNSIGFWEFDDNLDDSSPIKNNAIYYVENGTYDKSEGILGNTNGALDFSKKD